MSKNYYIITEITENLEKDWEHFLSTCKYSTFFHTYIWCSSLKYFDQNIKIFALCNHNNEIIAGITLLEKEKAKLKMAIRPWATPHTGILINDQLKYTYKKEIIDYIINFLVRRYKYIQLAMPIGYKDIYLFQKYKWSISVKNTFMHKRNSKVDFINYIEASARRQIKKAEKYNLEFRESNNISPLYEMYIRLFKKKGNPVTFSENQFTAFSKCILDAGLGKIYYIYYKGEPISGTLITNYQGIYYYTISASKTEYLYFGTPSYLIYCIVNTLKENEIFDFVGALPELESITKFKSKFNPEESPYFILEYGLIIKQIWNFIKKMKMILKSFR